MMSIETNELSELKRKVDKAALPAEAQFEAKRELARLINIQAESMEYGMICNYLDWVTTLPWNILSDEAIDTQHARKILDEDHYDLDQIKDRIIEYLAVKKLRYERRAIEKISGIQTVTQTPNPSAQAETTVPAMNIEQETSVDLAAREPILCFVGPPGVGKTSLGHSIARALNRKFVHLSLGGVQNEAEIRGDRRTVAGALPGRIIQGIKQAGTRNPVFMLDEIDKVSRGWNGDPTSALLEILDPTQNFHFVDHYLSVAFDLSQVLFIATANTLHAIPDALLDRMEVIRLSGYTDQEKVCIAEKFLIPKQCRAHGLNADEIAFSADAILQIIRGYAREAGVRDLDREIAKVCRKVARKIAEGDNGKTQVSKNTLKKYLGNTNYFDEVAERTAQTGVATGLAWTSSGGDLLFIEATLIPDRSSNLILTGMLGDVMRESAQTALSYVCANLKNLKTDPKVFQEKAVHMHLPSGAIPKDGPSAGVAMVTALVSLAINKRVRNDIAMTGEVTLRGRVLQVGGIKEKVLAAYRAGLHTVILPHHNEQDLEDIPTELRKQIKFILVDTVEEVLRHAFQKHSSVKTVRKIKQKN